MSVRVFQMKREMRTVPLSRAFRQVFIVWVLVLFGLLLHAQDIRIMVVNAHNGKPITDECINIWLGPLHGAGLLVPTNHEGVVVLHLAGNEVAADAVSPRACNRTAVVGPTAIPNEVYAITLSGDYYVACQEYGKVVPGEPATPNLVRQRMPSYSIKKILESGVRASNTCGKFRAAQVRPGELIFYVRPRSFSERMRQWSGERGRPACSASVCGIQCANVQNFKNALLSASGESVTQ
jgi:hypothetical protein